jgi:hypothetical protein
MEVETALNTLSALRESFQEFIENFSITRFANDTAFLIDFTVLSYDFIDDDLDFNEEYYNNLVAHFRKWLHVVCKQLVKDYKLSIICVENKMIFRTEKVVLSRHEFRPCYALGHDYVTQTVETSERV